MIIFSSQYNQLKTFTLIYSKTWKLAVITVLFQWKILGCTLCSCVFVCFVGLVQFIHSLHNRLFNTQNHPDHTCPNGMGLLKLAGFLLALPIIYIHFLEWPHRIWDYLNFWTGFHLCPVKMRTHTSPQRWSLPTQGSASLLLSTLGYPSQHGLLWSSVLSLTSPALYSLGQITPAPFNF